MEAFITPPRKIPFYLRPGIWLTRKITGKDLLPPKLLAWYPKAAVGSGVLESLVANGKKDLDKRILKIVRIQASFAVSCPFCIDMNSHEYADCGLSKAELAVLQGRADIDKVGTFSIREKLAVEYAKCVSGTPLSFPRPLIDRLKEQFTEREMVILASTAAQVNYWARLLQALGVPPAGFSDSCEL